MSDTFLHLLDVADGYEPCCDNPELDEKTGYPDGPNGQCDVFLVCDNCQYDHGVVGRDGVL